MCGHRCQLGLPFFHGIRLAKSPVCAEWRWTSNRIAFVIWLPKLMQGVYFSFVWGLKSVDFPYLLSQYRPERLEFIPLKHEFKLYEKMNEYGHVKNVCLCVRDIQPFCFLMKIVMISFSFSFLWWPESHGFWSSDLVQDFRGAGIQVGLLHCNFGLAFVVCKHFWLIIYLLKYITCSHIRLKNIVIVSIYIDMSGWIKVTP